MSCCRSGTLVPKGLNLYVLLAVHYNFGYHYNFGDTFSEVVTDVMFLWSFYLPFAVDRVI